MLAASFLLAFSFQAPPNSDPAAEFERAYADIERLMDARRWSDAYARFQELFREHVGAAYVVEQLPDLEQDLKRAAFYREHEEPPLKELLAAELLTWNRTTGDLHLFADGAHLDDFRKYALDEGYAFELPLSLADGWSVALRAKAGMLAQVQIHALIDAETSYVVTIGHRATGAEIFSKHDVARLGIEGAVALASAEPRPVDSDAERVVRVHVGADGLRLDVDGASVLRAKRSDRASYSRLAFVLPLGSSIESLELWARAESGWFDGLVDAAVERERAAFEAAWDPAEHLPAWLVTAGRARNPEALPDLGPFPVPETFDLHVQVHPRTAEHLGRIRELWRAGRFAAGLDYLRALDTAEIEPAMRAFLVSTTLYLGDRPLEAFQAGRELWEGQPSSVTARYLEAVLLVALKREEEARGIFEELTESHPSAWEPWYALASLELLRGRPDAARVALAEGAESVPDAAQLWRFESRLALLSRGPAWERLYEERAGHFTVRSDTDTASCRWVARECARVWREYERRLGPLELAEDVELPVFLFSGEASYRSYAADALQADAEHTAGLFDRRLQAILVWNTPARQTLLTTLRHEVLHHYLDARMGAVPTWFQEGMAEYFERPEAGTTGALAHPEHLATLARVGSLPPLEELIAQAPSAFYGSATTSYASAWALLHFLQESDLERRRVFDVLWQQLDQRADDASALQAAFSGIDWEAWNTAYAKHVDRLLTSAR